jgi:hypothetical protein
VDQCKCEMSCVASPHFFFTTIPTSAAAPARANTVPPTTTIPAPAMAAPRTPSARKNVQKILPTVFFENHN